jgi:excisionase family DNA binding protein
MSSTALPRKARLNLNEVAEYFGRTRRTIDYWLAAGKLPYVEDPSGQRRIMREDVLVFERRFYTDQRSTEIMILSPSE